MSELKTPLDQPGLGGGAAAPERNLVGGDAASGGSLARTQANGLPSAPHYTNGANPRTDGWEGLILQADDVAVLSRLEPAALDPGFAGPLNLKLEQTPGEFSHLYASLERLVANIGDVTLLTGESLGAERPYVLGVTSALEGEGKTTVALHLAMTVARDTFKNVCLIDLSLGRDDLARRLGAPSNGAGMVGVLEGQAQVVPTLRVGSCENLIIIPAGRRPTNPAKLARSPRVAQLIIAARHSFDVVIVDLPSVSSDNALPLARHLDGLIMVTQSGNTPSDVVANAVDVLGRDKVVGMVMNRTKSSVWPWLQRILTRA